MLDPGEGCGFRELVVDYRQPAFEDGSASADHPLHLLYKPFGRVYGDVELRTDEFLPTLEDILRDVYEIAEPRSHPTYTAVSAELSSRTEVPLREPSSVEIRSGAETLPATRGCA